MQWDDVLNDNKSNALNIDYSMRYNELLEFKQALLPKKKDKYETIYSVNREYINSPEFHAKFEKIAVNKNVQESLYNQSGRLLRFVDSLDDEKQFQERLLAIDAKTGEFIVDNFDRDGSIYHTGFDDNEYQKIDNHPNQIILLHNHSLNGLPSGQDLLTCLHNDKIAMSVIVCHNGDVYTVSDVKPEFEEEYKTFLNILKLQSSEIDNVQRIAMNKIFEKNQNVSQRHKIFTINKL